MWKCIEIVTTDWWWGGGTGEWRHQLRLAPALRTLGKDSSSALSLAYVVRETVGVAQ